MSEDSTKEKEGLTNPLLWGFLSTILMAFAGYIGFRMGVLALLWLPLATPVLALLYMWRGLHSFGGFERFLYGFMIALFTVTVAGIFLLALII